MTKILIAITQFFRSILWAIAEIFLFLLDCLWKVVLKIGTLDIGGSVVTTRFFAVMAACMLFFIVLKVVKIYVKFFVDEEYREKINLSKVLVSLSLASITISGAPLIYKTACSMTSDAIEHVNYWIPSSFAEERISADEINMSDILIQSGRVNLSNRESALGEIIRLNDDFDINATKTRWDFTADFFNSMTSLDDDEELTEGNAKQILESIKGVLGFNRNVYKYFPTFSSIFLEIILAVVALFIFGMTAIQIAMRSVICSMKYLLAPYVVATIIDPEDNSFSTWVRSISGDLMANFAQIYFTYFVLILCSNSAIQDALGTDWTGVFAKIALFIGGLLAVQEIPNVIAQFFGSSGQSMMETFRSTAFMASMFLAPGKAAAVFTGGGRGKSNENDEDSSESSRSGFDRFRSAFGSFAQGMGGFNGGDQFSQNNGFTSQGYSEFDGDMNDGNQSSTQNSEDGDFFQNPFQEKNTSKEFEDNDFMNQEDSDDDFEGVPDESEYVNPLSKGASGNDSQDGTYYEGDEDFGSDDIDFKGDNDSSVMMGDEYKTPGENTVSVDEDTFNDAGLKNINANTDDTTLNSSSQNVEKNSGDVSSFNSDTLNDEINPLHNDNSHHENSSSENVKTSNDETDNSRQQFQKNSTRRSRDASLREKELEAARRFGIRHAEDMPRDELRRQLRIRGYRFVSMEHNEQMNDSMYQNNFKRNSGEDDRDEDTD